MFCGLNAKKKNYCLISNIENLVAKVRSVKFSFLLSRYFSVGVSFNFCIYCLVITVFTNSTFNGYKHLWYVHAHKHIKSLFCSVGSPILQNLVKFSCCRIFNDIYSLFPEDCMQQPTCISGR